MARASSRAAVCLPTPGPPVITCTANPRAGLNLSCPGGGICRRASGAGPPAGSAPNEDGGKNGAGRAQDGIRAIPEAFAKPVAKVAPKIPSVDGAGARHCRGGG